MEKKWTTKIEKKSIGEVEIIISLHSNDKGQYFVKQYALINDNLCEGYVSSENKVFRMDSAQVINGKKINGLLLEDKTEIIVSDLKKAYAEQREKNKDISEITFKTHKSTNYFNDEVNALDLGYSKEALDKLIEIKAIKEKDFQYVLNDKITKDTFTYEEAKEMLKEEVEELEQKNIEKAAEKERIEQLFVTAKETGSKQLIREYSEACNDPAEDCDVDIVKLYAMPDGTETLERFHTW